jgi:hypothetical protein
VTINLACQINFLKKPEQTIEAYSERVKSGETMTKKGSDNILKNGKHQFNPIILKSH